MIIIPKKLHTSHSVVAMKESESDLEKFFQMCERSLMWRSKPSQYGTWQTRWKRGSYIKHLYGLTCEPSHSSAFVEKWTSSVEDSHANHSVLQAIKEVLTTQDTCSHTSQKESDCVNLELFSSKMWKESSEQEPTKENQWSNMSEEHWKKWVTQQRSEYSQRVKLACRISESESSSLVYPTPRLSDGEGGTVEAKLGSKSFYRENKKGEKWSVKLKDAVESMHSWSTPRANAVDSTRPNRKGGIPLAQQAKESIHTSWATPTARDFKDSPNDKTGRDMTLGKQVNGWSPNLQADPTNNSINGKPHESLQRGYLNPSWVEQMMGLPIGWTDSGYLETE